MVGRCHGLGVNLVLTPGSHLSILLEVRPSRRKWISQGQALSFIATSASCPLSVSCLIEKEAPPPQCSPHLSAAPISHAVPHLTCCPPPHMQPPPQCSPHLTCCPPPHMHPPPHMQLPSHMQPTMPSHQEPNTSSLL